MHFQVSSPVDPCSSASLKCTLSSTGDIPGHSSPQTFPVTIESFQFQPLLLPCLTFPDTLTYLVILCQITSTRRWWVERWHMIFIILLLSLRRWQESVNYWVKSCFQQKTLKPPKQEQSSAWLYSATAPIHNLYTKTYARARKTKQKKPNLWVGTVVNTVEHNFNKNYHFSRKSILFKDPVFIRSTFCLVIQQVRTPWSEPWANSVNTIPTWPETCYNKEMKPVL